MTVAEICQTFLASGCRIVASGSLEIGKTKHESLLDLSKFKCKHQIRELYKAGSLAERLAHDENQGTLVRMSRSAAALACDPLGGVARALLRLTV
jgi:hypothetical protein